MPCLAATATMATSVLFNWMLLDKYSHHLFASRALHNWMSWNMPSRASLAITPKREELLLKNAELMRSIRVAGMSTGACAGDVSRKCSGSGRLTAITAYHAPSSHPPKLAAMEALLERQVASFEANELLTFTKHVVVCSARTNVSRVKLRFARAAVFSELDVEPALARFEDHRADEYDADGALRLRRGRIVQMIIKLVAVKIVDTKFYLLLDADVVAIRPSQFCDFVVGDKAVASFSPSFATNQTRIDALRSVGQFSRWIRRSADALGVTSVTAPSGFYGVTPAVLNVDVVRALLAFLERRYGTTAWWTRVPDGWTEYGLYFVFLEALGLANAFHFCCEGQLYSASLWQSTPSTLFDTELMHRRQSYTLFGVYQSLRRGGSGSSMSSYLRSGMKLQMRRPPSVSRDLILRHWAKLERATDRSLEDTRPCDGSTSASHELVATYVASEAHVAAACITSRHVAATSPSRYHIALVDHDFNATNALRRCFPNRVIVAPPLHGVELGERYGIIHLFSMTHFDKIVHLGPGVLLDHIDELFDRPSPAASPDPTTQPTDFSSDVLVLVPNLSLSYLPLLTKLRAMKYVDRILFFKRGATAFLNFAFPKWRRKQLPAAFYLPPPSNCCALALGSATLSRSLSEVPLNVTPVCFASSSRVALPYKDADRLDCLRAKLEHAKPAHITATESPDHIQRQ